MRVHAPASPGIPWLGGVVVLLSLLLALLTGALAGLGSRLFLAPVAALIGALALALIPARHVVWALLIASFFVVGPAIYYGNIEVMRWLSPALAFALFLPWILSVMAPRRLSGPRVPQAGLVHWYALFLLAALFSTALSEPRLAEQIFASRMYLAYLSVTLVMSAGLLTASDQWQMWRFLLWTSVLQAPVAVYQALVVAPGRSFQNATWDAVVGTFPGNPEIGGANAGMSIFCLTLAVVALSLRQRGLISRGFFLLVLLSALVCIAVGEVKGVVLMMPIAAAIYYLPQILRRPVRAIAWVGVGVVLASGLLWAYNALYYEGRNPWSRDRVPMSAQESIFNQLDPALSQRGYIMGRMASFYDWGQRHAKSEAVPYAIMGHGVGALQIGRIGIGEAAEKLSYRADNTATGLLLWETGLLGHALVSFFLIAGAVTSFRLRDAEGVPPVHQAIAYAMCTGFVLHLLSLPYKDFMFRAAPSQALMFFMAGYVAYWARTARATKGAKVRPRVFGDFKRGV